MYRRSLLAVGASTLALAPAASGEDTADDGDDDEPEPPSDPDEPVARAVLGWPSADEPPHRIRLWNVADYRHSVGLEIESDSGRVSFDGEYDLEPEAHVVAVLHVRDRYDVTVTVDETAVGETELEASSFDDPCPQTDLFVLEDGEIEATMDPDADYCDEPSTSVRPDDDSFDPFDPDDDSVRPDEDAFDPFDPDDDPLGRE